MQDKGYVASPKGGPPSIDQAGSENCATAGHAKIRLKTATQEKLANTRQLATIKTRDYDAVFILWAMAFYSGT